MDPITLSSVGAAVISQGIKFLYGQATELLKRWRDRKESEVKSSAPAEEPVQVVLPDGAFEGQLREPVIHYQELDMVRDRLYASRKALSDYAEGLALPDLNDAQLLAELDVLRQLMEAIYQQRITFKGEKREPSGPVVEGEINVERILGNAAGVEAGSITQGRVKGTVKANEVGPNARAAGVKVDRIGK